MAEEKRCCACGQLGHRSSHCPQELWKHKPQRPFANMHGGLTGAMARYGVQPAPALPVVEEAAPVDSASWERLRAK